MHLKSILLFCIWGYFSCHTQPCKPFISYEQNNLHNHLDLHELFAPASTEELHQVEQAWKAFDPTSDDHAVIQTYNFELNRKVKLIQHETNNQKHHGILLYPSNFDSTLSYPVLVWAHGLNQQDPYVRFNHAQYETLAERLSDYALIIPSYRGQALEFYGETYCNDGFFGDAFDGATDDAIRLLHLVTSHYIKADNRRMAVCGVSRGGNVAMLMAARDPEIDCAIAIASPTDFLKQEVMDRYDVQFKYQFLSWPGSMLEIRQKIIASSPVYFIDNYPNKLLLIQGLHDRVVPPENGRAIIEILQGRANFQSVLLEAGHAFQDWSIVFEWLFEHN